MIKKQDSLGNKQDSFSKAILCMFDHEKLCGKSIYKFDKCFNNFGKFLEGF